MISRGVLAWLSTARLGDLAAGRAVPDRRSSSAAGPTSACSCPGGSPSSGTPEEPRRSDASHPSPGGARALMTSAGTVFVGLMLMGTTKFKLFSTTGPSVALGLVDHRGGLASPWPRRCSSCSWPASGGPRSFAGDDRRRPRGSGSTVRPPGPGPTGWRAGSLGPGPDGSAWPSWGPRPTFTQDTLAGDYRRKTALGGWPCAWSPRSSVRAWSLPLTVLLRVRRPSLQAGRRGLAMIDDLSRMLARQKFLDEVRSATQPLGRSGAAGSGPALEPPGGSQRTGSVRIEAGADAAP